jgi:hypothetical protein
MMTMARRVALVCVSLFVASSLAAQTPDYSPRPARTYAGDVDRPLTGPSSAAPRDIVTAFLRERGQEVAAASLVQRGSAAPARDGVSVFRFEQTVAGLRLYGAYARASLSANGELVHLIENLATGLPASVAQPGASARQALDVALRQLYPGQSMAVGAERRSGSAVVFDRTAFFHASPRVTRVAYQAVDGAIRAGLLVETWSEEANELHHTLVGGDGRVLFVESRTSSDSYNIFEISPRVSGQTVVQGPVAAEDAPSPEGWLSAGTQNSIRISGNNVNGYLDARSNNRPDSGGVAVTDGNFVTPVDLAQSPSTPTNRDVAVQNLFYLNNVIHDILYLNGFTEAAGNFQLSNFTNGGEANDPVNAEAQDGRGMNNANFATPEDGTSPRMQMYLWDGVGTHEVVVSAPASVAGSYKAFLAEFGDRLRRSVSGAVVVANDGVGSVTDGCEPLPAAVSGAIALVDRGGCTFVVKAANAQAAGAIGLIVANNVGGTDIAGLGGDDRSIQIPVLMISQNDGATLKGAAGVQATLQKAEEPPLNIDSSLDSDVVYHEYGHGLTWRMINGMSGPISGALGEGASDALAILVNGDDRIGEYSASSSVGIRRAPYATYPNSYNEVAGQSVHADGEIYAAIIWRLKTLFEANGLSRADLLEHFVNAMNYIPSSPTYEDMRAGLLQSVPDALDCLVWQAFAAFGVGEGSSATVTRTGVTVVESFNPTAACQP